MRFAGKINQKKKNKKKENLKKYCKDNHGTRRQVKQISSPTSVSVRAVRSGNRAPQSGSKSYKVFVASIATASASASARPPSQVKNQTHE